MAARGYGRILNVSSIWSLVGKPRRFAYSVAKSALNGLTRSLAVELADSGVLVNSVAPGFVSTELTRRNNSPEPLATAEGLLPLGRLAEPGEIAELVAFLSSSRNTFVTGQVIIADGATRASERRRSGRALALRRLRGALLRRASAAGAAAGGDASLCMWSTSASGSCIASAVCRASMPIRTRSCFCPSARSARRWPLLRSCTQS